jgi:hypothetical protein
MVNKKKTFTGATIIKNDFMTLIFLGVSFLNKHCKKECVHCRNYHYVIVKKFGKYTGADPETLKGGETTLGSQ